MPKMRQRPHNPLKRPQTPLKNPRPRPRFKRKNPGPDVPGRGLAEGQRMDASRAALCRRAITADSPIAAGVGAVAGGATGAMAGARAASQPGYYLAQGNCYYRYPSGQYVLADPRACY